MPDCPSLPETAGQNDPVSGSSPDFHLWHWQIPLPELSGRNLYEIPDVQTELHPEEWCLPVSLYHCPAMQCKVLPVPGISYIPAVLLSYIRSFWNSLAQCRSRSSSLRRKRCLEKAVHEPRAFFRTLSDLHCSNPSTPFQDPDLVFPSTAVCIFRYFIVSAACVGCDVHIAPHHWFQVKFFTDCQYSVTVFPDQRGTLFVSVFLQIISQSKLHCLIHSQMNTISMKSFFYRFQHPFDELIGFFLSYLKDVGSVFDLLPARPISGHCGDGPESGYREPVLLRISAA